MRTTSVGLVESASQAEPVLDITAIKELMDGFDPAALLPDLERLLGSLAPVCRVAVLAGPVVMLLLGLSYLILAPKEANYYFGYRCYFGMGSVYAWRFTQRLAGVIFTLMGLGLTAAAYSVSAGFAAMAVTDMVGKALLFAALEAALALLAVLTVNFTAALRFNRKGNHRRKHRQKPRS